MAEQVSKLNGEGLRIAIIVSRFNSIVTERLLDGARQALRENGVGDSAVQVVEVPGAFELPLPAKLMADSGRFDAIV
jgi:6,7-dimethyl-8-ribityllumazine synthase